MARRAGTQFADDARGGTAIEYTLIMALIFLAIVGAVTRFANANDQIFNKLETEIANATT